MTTTLKVSAPLSVLPGIVINPFSLVADPVYIRDQDPRQFQKPIHDAPAFDGMLVHVSADAVVQVGDAGALDNPRSVQMDGCALEIVEEPDAVAE